LWISPVCEKQWGSGGVTCGKLFAVRCGRKFR